REHEVFLDDFRRAARAHGRHRSAILAHDEGEARGRLHRAAARAALEVLRQRRTRGRLDGSGGVVRLAERGATGGGPWRHAGLSPRGDDDALLRAAQVAEYRSVRDPTAALVAEQGDASDYPVAMGGPPYLTIPR